MEKSYDMSTLTPHISVQTELCTSEKQETIKVVLSFADMA